MPNYSDLQTLFNNGMGSYAALQAGRQTGMDEQLNALKAQQLQEQINQQKQMNPLDLMFRQQEIEQAKANTANTQAVGQNNQVNANIAQATQAKTIAAKLSSMSTQIGEDGMKQMGQDAEKALGAAQMLQGVPAMARPQALSAIMEKYGVDKDNPLMKPILEGDPNNMVTSLQNLGQGMALASSDFIKNSKLQKDKQAFEATQGDLDRKNRTTISAGNNAATIQAAKISADARIQVAQAAADARKSAVKFMNSDQKLTYLSGIPAEERTPEESQQLEQLSKQRIAERSAGVNPLASQMTGQPSAIQSAQQATPFAAGTQSAPAGVDAQTKAAVEAKGFVYDPNYNYKITPDGKVFRKPKGQ